MVEVEISFCAACGYLRTAIDVVKLVLRRLAQDISAFKLLPGKGGVLDVVIDGDLVFLRHDVDRFPTGGEIVEEIERRLS